MKWEYGYNGEKFCSIGENGIETLEIKYINHYNAKENFCYSEFYYFICLNNYSKFIVLLKIEEGNTVEGKFIIKITKADIIDACWFSMFTASFINGDFKDWQCKGWYEHEYEGMSRIKIRKIDPEIDEFSKENYPIAWNIINCLINYRNFGMVHKIKELEVCYPKGQENCF